MIKVGTVDRRVTAGRPAGCPPQKRRMFHCPDIDTARRYRIVRLRMTAHAEIRIGLGQ